MGGFFYQSLTTTFPQAFGRAIAIIILGALIGFFIGLVGELPQARMVDGRAQPEPQCARGAANIR